MSKETLRGLERGLSVLDALEGSEGLSLRELHRHTELPKPTLLRILATLEAKGYARRRIADGGWRRTAHRRKPPSSRLDALRNDIGGEVLDELCRRVVWPSDLAVYRQGAMEILDTSRRLTPFVINHAGIGLRIPILQSGLGLAWLAYCPDDERKAALAIMMASDSPYDRPVREPGVADEAIAETRARLRHSRQRLSATSPYDGGEYLRHRPADFRERTGDCHGQSGLDPFRARLRDFRTPLSSRLARGGGGDRATRRARHGFTRRAGHLNCQPSGVARLAIEGSISHW
jgi:IclR family mhp operon transcriptional activator